MLGTALCVAALAPSGGSAHPGHPTASGSGSQYTGKGLLASLPSDEVAQAAVDMSPQAAQAALPAGPCTDEAAASMPTGEGHDHSDISQHRFRCRMEQVAFLSLKEQLADRENVILGEIDAKKGIAAVSVTYPRAGILFFDVSDPSRPKYLSRWDGTECDQLVIDINCGAFVSLSDDGTLAFLSVQKLSFLPMIPPDPNAGNQSGPGVEVIDVSDPRNPEHVQTYPIAGIGGIHTVRYHTIPEGPSSTENPRAPGEYVISNQNGVGIDIAKLERLPNGRPFLRTIRQVGSDYVEATIINNEVHDTFIQNDPLDGRTYLYNAAGFATGFHVYDITDPERIELVAEWDPTPECDEDWYAHTIDVKHSGGRRYVTMPAELFLQKDDSSESGLAEMSDEDKAEGCGSFVGNGDKQGPLWIVDATDLSKLGPADDLKSGSGPVDTDAELKQNSEDALVATWTNPAGRAAGSLTFTPHNQQIVGDRIYLSHYHGGVYVLDASAAFAGQRERPKELGFIVPHGGQTRPLLGQPPLTGLQGRFFTDFPLGRPEIWDAVYWRGYVLAADMTGGFYSLRYEDDPCIDDTAPLARIGKRGIRLRRRGVRVRGRAIDTGCRGTKRVRVAIGRKVRGKCRFLRRNGRFTRRRSCRRPLYLKARGTSRWRLRKRAKLPRGRYVIRVLTVDEAGNRRRSVARRRLK